jgi:hypothetical protein
MIEIESVSLFVKRVILNPAARALLSQSLSSGGKLHYQRLHTIAFPCAQGSRTWTWHNCFNNIAPRRVFVALVTQEAYFGSWRYGSTYLESSRISRVRFCLDGREIMPEPYETTFAYAPDGMVDPKATDAKSAFAGITRVMNNFGTPTSRAGINYANYINGSTLFGVDLDHADALGPVLGSLDIHMEFSEGAAPAPMMVLVMGEYPKTVVLDGNRQVTEM